MAKKRARDERRKQRQQELDDEKKQEANRSFNAWFANTQTLLINLVFQENSACRSTSKFEGTTMARK